MDKSQHDAIVELLQIGTKTQSEIARMFGCHSCLISLIAKELGLRPGRGKRPWSHWVFTGFVSPLAYLVGFFLTDGTLNLRTGQIHWMSTERALVCATKETAAKIGFRPRVRDHPRGLKQKPMQVVLIYSVDFCRWLNAVCAGKSRIPSQLNSAELTPKLAFLAGVIDGDGRVRNEGSIEVRGTKGFVQELPAFLKAMGIRSHIRQEAILVSGKPYMSVSVRRSDFVAAGGWCHHPEKQRRIIEGKNTRKRKLQRSQDACPICGNPKETRAHRCQRCYRASPESHAHLRKIAPSGNLAGNRARWGHKHH